MSSERSGLAEVYWSRVHKTDTGERIWWRASLVRSPESTRDAAGGAEGFHGDGVEVVVEMEDCP